MSSPEVESTEEYLGPDAEQCLRSACALLERQLREGRPARCEDLFARWPLLAEDPDRALDLIYTEYATRRELGQAVDPEEYYRRFPPWNSLLVQQFRFDDLLDDTPPDGTLDLEPLEPFEAPTQVISVDGPNRAAIRFREADTVFRYQPIRPLARGGLGKISVALDTELNREVALKQLREHLADHPASRSRFVVEAEITGRLEHPGIVPVYGLGRDARGRPFYTMRLIRGRSLQDAIDTLHVESPSLLELRRLLRRFLDVCDAIAYAHSRGVLHRDLKPANILLGPYGETLVVDWGLAKVLGRSDPDAARDVPPAREPDPETTLKMAPGAGTTLAGATLGTPAFMSPEQAAGQTETVGPTADVYGLGATLYSLLTGRPPFRPERDDLPALLDRVRRGDFARPRALVPLIPKPLEAICLKAMATDPRDRYAGADRLAQDLERWLDDEPVLAYRESRGQRLARWGRRHRAWVDVGLLAVPIIGTILVGALVGVDAARRTAVNERVEADHQRDSARRQTARLAVDRALSLQDQGRYGDAMAWMARALETLPPGDVALRRVIRTNLAAWRTQVIRLRAELDHPSPISRAFLTPDGQAVLTIDRDRTMRLREIGTGAPLGPLMRSSSSIRAAAVSPDGQLILTAGGDGLARFWDVLTNAPAWPMPDLPHSPGRVIGCVAFAPEGRTVLTGGDDGMVRLWDLEWGFVRTSFRHTSAVQTAVFRPDGGAILTRCADRSAWLWDASTGRRLAALHQEGPVNLALFSPDGRYVLTCGPTTSRLRDAGTGQPIAALESAGDVRSAVFSPDGRLVLTGAHDGTARLWDVPSGKSLGLTWRHQESVMGVAFAPDGRAALTGSYDGTARLWDLPSGLPLAEPIQHASYAQDVEIVASSGGRSILTRSGDGRAFLWSWPEGAEPPSPWLDQGELISLAFAPDRQTLATGDRPGGVVLRSAETGARLGPPLRHQGLVKTIAFRPDCRAVLTGSHDNTARVWAVPTGEPLGPPMEHDDQVPVALFAPDGTSILTADRSGTVRLWEETGARRVWSVDLGMGVVCGAIDPSGRTAVLGTVRGTVDWIRLADGARLGGARQRGAIRWLTFSPSGHLVLTASDDGTAQFWDAASRMPLGAPMKHAGQVWTAAFSPDGRTAATGGMDATARLWDVPTGRPRSEPLRLPRPVMAVAFSPDSRLLLTGSINVSRLWDVETGLPVGQPVPQRGGFWSLEFRPDGRKVATDRLWDVPTPLPDRPDLLVDWVGLITQRHLGPDNAVDRTDAETHHAAASRFERQAGRPWDAWPEPPQR